MLITKQFGTKIMVERCPSGRSLQRAILVRGCYCALWCGLFLCKTFYVTFPCKTFGLIKKETHEKQQGEPPITPTFSCPRTDKDVDPDLLVKIQSQPARVLA